MKEKVFDASYVSAFCMEMYLIIGAGIPSARVWLCFVMMRKNSVVEPFWISSINN